MRTPYPPGSPQLSAEPGVAGADADHRLRISGAPRDLGRRVALCEKPAGFLEGPSGTGVEDPGGDLSAGGAARAGPGHLCLTGQLLPALGTGEPQPTKSGPQRPSSE